MLLLVIVQTELLLLLFPDSHYWGWQGFTKGIDYVDFNGARLLAVQNGSGSFNGAQRLYVADITKNPNANSMSDGFIFDSQQGNTIGNADVPGGVPGSGYTATGYTSPWAFDGVSSVLGENIPCTGDVILPKVRTDWPYRYICLLPIMA